MFKAVVNQTFSAGAEEPPHIGQGIANGRCLVSHTTLRCSGNASMSGEDEALDWKHQRLHPQQHGVDDSDGIHPVQNQTPRGAHVLG